VLISNKKIKNIKRHGSVSCQIHA